MFGGFLGGSAVQNLLANAGDSGSIPGSGRSPGEGNGNPLQYSCLENPMDRGALCAIVHGVSKRQGLEPRYIGVFATKTIQNIGVSEVKLLSLVRLFTTPWTVAYQAPPFMGFSRQEYWSGLAFPSPGDLPNPGNLGLSNCRQTLYHLSHQGSP